LTVPAADIEHASVRQREEFFGSHRRHQTPQSLLVLEQSGWIRERVPASGFGARPFLVNPRDPKELALARGLNG
jgi:hypothetical protein